MARAARVGCVLVVWGAFSGAMAAEPRGSGSSAGPAPRVYPSDSSARGVVERAILGAQHRLGRSGCRQVFTDFTDQSGRPLLANLDATDLPAADYLVERIWFVDGSDAPQCVKHLETAAFTETGSKVVHVCAARFARLAQQTTAAEILIIHELLHTLGLGENPPSSKEITYRVTARCGGS